LQLTGGYQYKILIPAAPNVLAVVVAGLATTYAAVEAAAAAMQLGSSTTAQPAVAARASPEASRFLSSFSMKYVLYSTYI
jgi:hypothetical protein